MKGPGEDPTISTTIESGSASTSYSSNPGQTGKNSDSNGDDADELVVMIAGGMTSKLTYDGVDVCASRVAWEVSFSVARLRS